VSRQETLVIRSPADIGPEAVRQTTCLAAFGPFSTFLALFVNQGVLAACRGLPPARRQQAVTCAGGLKSQQS